MEKYRVKNKTKEIAYAGRKIKLEYMNNRVPKGTEILTDMPQSKLLREMAKLEVFLVEGMELKNGEGKRKVYYETAQ